MGGRVPHRMHWYTSIAIGVMPTLAFLADVRWFEHYRVGIALTLGHLSNLAMASNSCEEEDAMQRSWKVQSRTDNLLELQRDGEILEIERPIDQAARFVFAGLRVGQLVHDDLIRILTGEDHMN